MFSTLFSVLQFVASLKLFVNNSHACFNVSRKKKIKWTVLCNMHTSAIDRFHVTSTLSKIQN